MLLPDTIGKYTVVDRLATGGMAEVYLGKLANEHGFEKLAAIKRIRPELSGDRRALSFFLDEARLVATLEHPNIAQVYEMGEVGGSFFFVMEYVRGSDLRELLATARDQAYDISLANALYIVSCVCAGLHYAHDKRGLDGSSLQIIHRDVSPSNVLLSRDGAVKVCDFGIAKATNRTAETVRGVLKGKLGYMSPEQCRSEQLDRRSDIFSIGILLYELTTLTRLFDAPSDFELLRAIAEDPIAPPSRRVPGYPPQLERIVMRALARSRVERYPTALALQLDLEDFAREHRLTLSSIHLANMMGELFDREPSDTDRAPRQSPISISSAPLYLPAPSVAAEGTPFAREVIAPRKPRRRSRPQLRERASEGELEPDTLVSSRAISPARGLRHHIHRHRNALLLAALGATLLAGGASLAGAVHDWTQEPATAAAIDGEAERIQVLLESTARAARIRATGIASLPMLRAAIQTDATTMRDVLADEHPVPLGPREAIELFQLGYGKIESLARVPEHPPAERPLPDGQTRLELRGDRLVMRCGATIKGVERAPDGALDLTVAVDLAAEGWRMPDTIVRASLVGPSGELGLVSSPASAEGAPAVRVPLALPGIAGDALSLIATPRPPARLAWVAPLRNVGFAFAGLLLLVCVSAAGRRTTRPGPVPPRS